MSRRTFRGCLHLPRLSFRPALQAILMALFAAGSAAGDEPSTPANPAINIEQTRETVEQWVETKRIISKDKRDLALAKEMLGQRIGLVRREIETLETKIVEAEGNIVEAGKKRNALVAENERLKEAAEELGDALVLLEEEVRVLLPSLPETLLERIKPLTQRLPGKDAETRLSTSERFQNVVGILNEVDKFNREITVVSELRTLPDDTSVEVTSLYIGLGQAYYVGASGRVGGIGIPTPEGWVWQPADSLAPQIARAVAIIGNEQAPAFIQFPVKFQ